MNSPSLAQYCVTWEFKTDATTYTAFDCDGNDIDDNDDAAGSINDGSATATATPEGDPSSSSSTPIGAIVGGVVGGVVALILIVVVLFLVRRRKRVAANREQLTASPPPPPEGPQEISTSDASYPDGYVPPNPYYDPKTHTHFFEAPDTAVVEAPNSEAPVLHEAPNTATLGNRKELE